MPRGKNYVNNHKGMALHGHAKASKSMELCFYGDQCTRPHCIYKHVSAGTSKDGSATTTNQHHHQLEPCRLDLAGLCHATAATCKKRHTVGEERQRLLTKMARTPCRFALQCKTKNCLYQHPMPFPPNAAAAATMGGPGEVNPQQAPLPTASSVAAPHHQNAGNGHGPSHPFSNGMPLANYVVPQPPLPQPSPAQHHHPSAVPAYVPSWFGPPPAMQHQQQQHPNGMPLPHLHNLAAYPPLSAAATAAVAGATHEGEAPQTALPPQENPDSSAATGPEQHPPPDGNVGDFGPPHYPPQMYPNGGSNNGDYPLYHHHPIMDAGGVAAPSLPPYARSFSLPPPSSAFAAVGNASQFYGNGHPYPYQHLHPQPPQPYSRSLSLNAGAKEFVPYHDDGAGTDPATDDAIGGGSGAATTNGGHNPSAEAEASRDRNGSNGMGGVIGVEASA